MLKQLIDVKSNKIFVLQTAGKGTSCPACVWQTDLHTGTAAVCEPALSFTHDTRQLLSISMYSNKTTSTLASLSKSKLSTFPDHSQNMRKCNTNALSNIIIHSVLDPEIEYVLETYSILTQNFGNV